MLFLTSFIASRVTGLQLVDSIGVWAPDTVLLGVLNALGVVPCRQTYWVPGLLILQRIKQRTLGANDDFL